MRSKVAQWKMTVLQYVFRRKENNIKIIHCCCFFFYNPRLNLNICLNTDIIILFNENHSPIFPFFCRGI